MKPQHIIVETSLIIYTQIRNISLFTLINRSITLVSNIRMVVLSCRCKSPTIFPYPTMQQEVIRRDNLQYGVFIHFSGSEINLNINALMQLETLGWAYCNITSNAYSCNTRFVIQIIRVVPYLIAYQSNFRQKPP